MVRGINITLNLFRQAADEPRVLGAELALGPGPLAIGFLHQLNVAVGAGLLLRRHHVQPGSNLQPFACNEEENCFRDHRTIVILNKIKIV